MQAVEDFLFFQVGDDSCPYSLLSLAFIQHLYETQDSNRPCSHGIQYNSSDYRGLI